MQCYQVLLGELRDITPKKFVPIYVVNILIVEPVILLVGLEKYSHMFLVPLAAIWRKTWGDAGIVWRLIGEQDAGDAKIV